MFNKYMVDGSMDGWIDGWMGKYIAIISPQRISMSTDPEQGQGWSYNLLHMICI